MANTFIHPQIVAREALMALRSNTIVSSLVHRDYEAEFSAGAIGDTVQIKAPPVFTAQEFTTSVSVQNITQTKVDLTLEKHFDVSVEVTSKEMTLELDDFSRTIVIPAMEAIAEKMDTYIYSKYVDIYNYIGTAGTPPASLANMADISAFGDTLKISPMNRLGLVNPAAKAKILSVSDLVRTESRGDSEAIRRAMLGEILGVNYAGVHNVQKHTGGTLSDGTSKAALVNGAVLADAVTMNIDSTTLTGTLVKGDVFTVAGVYRYDGTSLMQFVVTNASPITAGSNALAGVTFYPAAPTGGFADGAAVVFAANHVANIAGDLKRGLALACVPLELPIAGAAPGAVASFEGFAIRVVYDYDSSSKKNKVSFDLLAGAKVIDPRRLFRILG